MTGSASSMTVRRTGASFCGLGGRGVLIVIFVQSLGLMRGRLMATVTAVTAVHAKVHPQHATNQ